MSRNWVRSGGQALLTAPLALAGGWIAYSHLVLDHALPLPRAIDAELYTFDGPRSGRLAYYAAREAPGRPLVLIHSINAAGSSYEMRPLFEHYRAARPVYALDLPGFGFSERSARPYSPPLYQDAILEFLESQVGEPADVVALSLGGEFAARAARAHPERFRSLSLISPSGFAEGAQKRASQRAGDDGSSWRWYEVLSFPLWGLPLYDLIATRRSIHFFLAQSFSGEVDPGLEEYAYATSHQPGAEHAPLYFISGQLFTPNVREEIYARLELPALVIFDRDAFVSFDTLPEFLNEHANWRSARIQPTKGLPQFEELPRTTAALDGFWEGAE